MKDTTGEFQTLDWQALQLIIVPYGIFHLQIGSGLYYEISTYCIYVEHDANCGLHFMGRKINTEFGYRYWADYNTDSIPKQEDNIKIDYIFFLTKRWDFNVMVGFDFQRYYSEVDFYYFQAGLKILFSASKRTVLFSSGS